MTAATLLLLLRLILLLVDVPSLHADPPCPSVLRHPQLSDEQLYQLHEFMTATQDLYDPNSKTAPGPPGPPSADGSAETAQTGPQGSSQMQGGAVGGGGVGGGGVGGAGEGEEKGQGNGQSEGEKALRDILESSAPDRRR